MDEFLLVPSFYFSVEVDDDRVEFQEVSGLEGNLEVEEVIEGGNNLYKHRLPVRHTYNNITLAKGVIKEDDAFYIWVKEAILKQASLASFFENGVRTIKIDLMSPKDAEIIRSWQVVNAFPVKWSISNLNASENKIAIDTVQLAFQYLEALE